MDLLKGCTGAAQANADSVDKLSGLKGKALLQEAGCSILSTTSDPEVKKIIEEKGWPLDKPVLLGPPSDSAVRPAMYVVHNNLHTDGKVAMFPIDFMKDLKEEWYGTLTGGKREVPVMIYEGFVVGESIPILRVLESQFSMSPPLSDKDASLIQRVQDTKQSSDALLKHFGFCKMAEGAKPYRQKGGLQGEGLKWVKEHLKPVSDLLDEWEGILKDSQFLSGSELGMVDCASIGTIGSLYHITEAPIDKNYPNCWRYYQEVKSLFLQRSDWEEISKTGCGFFKAFEQFETFVKVFNCERRFFACCSGREALSNPTYWEGVNDVVSSHSALDAPPAVTSGVPAEPRA